MDAEPSQFSLCGSRPTRQSPTGRRVHRNHARAKFQHERCEVTNPYVRESPRRLIPFQKYEVETTMRRYVYSNRSKLLCDRAESVDRSVS
jgi:hypothetical protein